VGGHIVGLRTLVAGHHDAQRRRSTRRCASVRNPRATTSPTGAGEKSAQAWGKMLSVWESSIFASPQGGATYRRLIGRDQPERREVDDP